MMTNRSDWGSAKPRGSRRFERDDVISEPACGLHQGQQPYSAARTGRIHGCTRAVPIAAQSSCAAGVAHKWTYNDRSIVPLRWCRGRPRHHIGSRQSRSLASSCSMPPTVHAKWKRTPEADRASDGGTRQGFRLSGYRPHRVRGRSRLSQA